MGLTLIFLFLLFICFYIRRCEYENPTSTQVWSKALKTLTQKSNLEDQQDRREKEQKTVLVVKIIPKWKKLRKLGLKPQEVPRQPLILPPLVLQKRVTVKCLWNNWPLMCCRPRPHQVLTLKRTNSTTYSWLWTYSY